MGTHPIFESDFDCLTEQKMVRTSLKRKFDGQELERFVRVVVPVRNPSTNPSQLYAEGTILKVDVNCERAFVYLDGGNCDWWAFKRIAYNNKVKSRQEVLDSIKWNSDVSEEDRNGTIFYIQQLFKAPKVPVLELRPNELSTVCSATGKYVHVRLVKDMMVFVSSNQRELDRRWIFCGSLIFEDIREQLGCNSPGFVCRAPNGDHVTEVTSDTVSHSRPPCPTPRAFTNGRFDSRALMAAETGEQENPEMEDEAEFRLSRAEHDGISAELFTAAHRRAQQRNMSPSKKSKFLDSLNSRRYYFETDSAASDTGSSDDAGSTNHRPPLKTEPENTTYAVDRILEAEMDEQENIVPSACLPVTKKATARGQTVGSTGIKLRQTMRPRTARRNKKLTSVPFKQ